MACAVSTTNPPAARAQGTGIGNLFGQNLGHNQASAELEITQKLTALKLQPGEVATLSITVKLPQDYYIYSTNRKISSAATRLSVTKTVGLTPLDEEFKADRPPKAIVDPYVGKVEKFFRQVTWSRRYRIAANAQLDKVSLSGELKGAYCSSGPAGLCIPIRPPHQFTAVLTQGAPPSAGSPESDAAQSHPFTYQVQPARKPGNPEPITLRFDLSPKNAKPGDEVTLAVTAKLKDEWHTFSLTQDPKMAGRPTIISIARLNGLQPVANTIGFEPSKRFEKEMPLKNIVQQVHYGEITWKQRFEVLKSAGVSGYGVAGDIKYQACRKGQCRFPMSVEFALGNLAGKTTGVTQQAGPTQESGGLPWYLLCAFLGGLVLNVMPCVLPVIAIKVMSFVQQAGESRSRIFTLNLVYAAGVISVFLGLATLAVVAGIGWGGLFRSSEFNLVMACVVFAMGLSMLGLFEFPVPGFVGSAAGSHQGEGLTGAFLTGILATLLATPCSGPLMGATLGWSVSQPTVVTYLVWGVMGLGMAFPYLVIGVFPGAVKWLPKPGAWMVRLKEFAGFVLMGTVIFIITILDENLVAPLLVMLLGIALGLWMIGNLYDVKSDVKRKTLVRLYAFALTTVICLVGYGWGKFSGPELPWKPFSEAKLEASLAKNKTVLIDFTADW